MEYSINKGNYLTKEQIPVSRISIFYKFIGDNNPNDYVVFCDWLIFNLKIL